MCLTFCAWAGQTSFLDIVPACLYLPIWGMTCIEEALTLSLQKLLPGVELFRKRHGAAVPFLCFALVWPGSSGSTNLNVVFCVFEALKSI